MKKIALIIALSTMVGFTPVSAASNFNREFSIPTKKAAVIDGKIQPKIQISNKTCSVNPWLYVDIKLDAIKSKQGNINYADNILRKIRDYFISKGLTVVNGDFYVVLNNGYVVNQNNWYSTITSDVLKEQILQKDYYKGDTICTLAFLYDNNTVKRTTYWKLIDAIDLPAGSTHTLNKTYTIGISKNEEIKIGQTFGLKFEAEANASAGADFKYGSFKTSSKLSNEINLTASKNFENTREIKSVFESHTNVAYTASEKDRAVLRYQLVDNYKVTNKTFKDATGDLTNWVNSNGEKLVKFVPAGGSEGIDVPTDEVFDVTIDK